LLERPENRRFAGAVRPLALPGGLRGVSSSAVRAGDAGADVLPPESRAFVEETAAYTEGSAAERYRRRLSALDDLEAGGISPSEARARLRAASGG
jgi:hypothetical protein